MENYFFPNLEFSLPMNHVKEILSQTPFNRLNVINVSVDLLQHLSVSSLFHIAKSTCIL